MFPWRIFMSFVQLLTTSNPTPHTLHQCLNESQPCCCANIIL
jgi:hypothetical protein